MRAARRALGNELSAQVAAAGPSHPAADAYADAQQWAARTRDAASTGDGRARQYAANAQQSARTTQGLLDQQPPAIDPDGAAPPVPGTGPDEEDVRAATALAHAAAGAGGPAVPIERQDGGRTVAWDSPGFAGAATVSPGEDGDHPCARLVFTDLDRDRYRALADSPWPYRTEHGSVIYERMPVDQAEQIIQAAAGKRPGRPWERHGLGGGESRERLDQYYADDLEPESEAWAAQLTDREAKWTRIYTSEHYAVINEHLFTGRSHDEPVRGSRVPLRAITEHLDSAIARAVHGQWDIRVSGQFRSSCADS